jgi:hypothetical protein
LEALVEQLQGRSYRVMKGQRRGAAPSSADPQMRKG